MVFATFVYLFLYFSSQQNQTDEQSAQDKKITSQNQSNTIAVLPTATPSSAKKDSTSTGSSTSSGDEVVSATISVTPFPGSGDLDWTRNDGINREKLEANKAARSISACELSGLESSWENPVEKFVCDSMDFFDQKVIEGLNQLACTLSLGNLQSNLDPNLEMAYIDGECRIIDRK